MYRITFDGSVADEHGFVAMGGQADQVASVLKERYAEGMPLVRRPGGGHRRRSSRPGQRRPHRRSAPRQLEVAVLARDRVHRTFRRLTGSGWRTAARRGRRPAPGRGPPASRPRPTRSQARRPAPDGGTTGPPAARGAPAGRPQARPGSACTTTQIACTSSAVVFQYSCGIEESNAIESPGPSSIALEPDAGMQRSACDEAVLLAVVTQRAPGVGGVPAGLVDHLEEVHPVVRARGEPLPAHPAGQVDRAPLAGPLHDPACPAPAARHPAASPGLPRASGARGLGQPGMPVAVRGRHDRVTRAAPRRTGSRATSSARWPARTACRPMAPTFPARSARSGSASS